MELQLVECPRDAMQGLHTFIPTEQKVRYINALLKVGFHSIDFGSFVSPKAIPQMADTARVLGQLDLDTNSKLLAIVANQRGAEDAAKFEAIDYLGYPFSISETFQIRNTNATIEESLERVKVIQEICVKSSKKLIIYISMGFGNPYGDAWDAGIVAEWVEKLAKLGIEIFSLSDTIGVAQPDSISYIFGSLIPQYPDLTFGGHFHTKASNWKEKLEAAYENGCRRFDSAIKGYGGCPMAKDDLTGNMATENVLFYLQSKGLRDPINLEAFLESMQIAAAIFPSKHF